MDSASVPILKFLFTMFVDSEVAGAERAMEARMSSALLVGPAERLGIGVAGIVNGNFRIGTLALLWHI
jgi:hypothetical protein